MRKKERERNEISLSRRPLNPNLVERGNDIVGACDKFPLAVFFLRKDVRTLYFRVRTFGIDFFFKTRSVSSRRNAT